MEEEEKSYEDENIMMKNIYIDCNSKEKKILVEVVDKESSFEQFNDS